MQTERRSFRAATYAAVAGLALSGGLFVVPEALDITPAADAARPSRPTTTLTAAPTEEGEGEGEGEGVSAKQASTIDFSKAGSITIHKRAGERTDKSADGNELADPPGTPLNGVEYKVTLIKAYNSAADVVEGQKLTLEQALAETEGKQPVTGTTAGDGVASFKGLALGRYLVEEVSAPAGHVPGGPFLVSVPMTNPATQTGWNYDVQVYPKNTENKAEKAVVDAGQHTGDEITYTITSDIPTPSESGLSKYEIIDPYDTTMLTVSPDEVTAELSNGVKLEAGTDFTADTNESGELVIQFKPAGLDKLSKDHTERVITTIPATVQAIDGDEKKAEGESTGGVVVENKATVISNEGSGGPDGSTETDPVETYFGKLRVEKIDEAGAPLDGAKFQLYNCANKGELTEQITVDGATEWTTGADGSLTINALHVTDFANDASVEPAMYCLVEIEAPKGHELLAEPVEVNFTREAIGAVGDGEGSADDSVTLVKDITNVKSTAPSLPLTGGMGIGIIAALGALIIGAGAWLAKRNSSKA